MATSISGLYRQELKAIREEQDVSASLAAQEDEKSKMFGGGSMQVQSYIGAGAKKLSGSKIGTEFQYMKDDQLISGKKFQSLAPDKGPTWFGDKEMGETSASLWESAQEYTGMEFGGADQTSKVGLTSEYVQGALTEGAGIKEFGISAEDISYEKLFPSEIEGIVPGEAAPQGLGLSEQLAWEKAHPDVTKMIPQTYKPGSEAAITAKIGEESVEIGTAVVSEKVGEMSVKIAEEGTQKAIEGTAKKSAESVAGKAAAGVGVVTGGAQMLQSEGLGDKDFYAGGLKAVGSALMFTPAAPIGAALSTVGTLLDFV